MNKNLRALFCIGLLWSAASSSDKICAPNFELINLETEFSLSSMRVLETKMDELGSRDLLPPASTDTIKSNSPQEEQNQWARTRGCTHLLQVSLTRLGERVQVASKASDLSNDSVVYSRVFRAMSPDDLLPIMGQIANGLSNPKFAHVETIYDVSQADARVLTKKRSTSLYSAHIGYHAYGGSDQFIMYGFGLLWDNRSFLGEFAILFGKNANGAEFDNKVSLSMQIYKPLNTEDNSFYFGGGLGLGSFGQKVTENNLEQNVNRSGLLLITSAGYMFGRTSDLRVRGQADANLLIDQMEGMDMPIGGGIRMIIDFDL